MKLKGNRLTISDLDDKIKLSLSVRGSGPLLRMLAENYGVTIPYAVRQWFREAQAGRH